MIEERCPCGAKPLGSLAGCVFCADCWPVVALEDSSLRLPVPAPTLRYRCSCPAQRSDKIKAFCDTHLVGLERNP